jgi:hypothetical protein
MSRNYPGKICDALRYRAKQIGGAIEIGELALGAFHWYGFAQAFELTSRILV